LFRAYKIKNIERVIKANRILHQSKKPGLKIKKIGPEAIGFVIIGFSDDTGTIIQRFIASLFIMSQEPFITFKLPFGDYLSMINSQS